MGYASLPFAPPRHHQNLRLRTLYEKSCVKLQTHNILPRRRRERVRSVPERPPLEAASLRPHLHPRHPAFWPHGDDRGIISSSSLVNTAFSLERDQSSGYRISEGDISPCRPRAYFKHFRPL